MVHSAIKGIEVIDETPSEVKVMVGAGEKMDDFILWACDRRLWGIENLSGIPGEVGASAVQNVGAYGQPMPLLKSMPTTEKGRNL